MFTVRPVHVLWMVGAAAVSALPGCDSVGSDRPRATVLHLAIVARAKDDPTWAVLQDTARRFERQDRRAAVEVLAPETPSPRAQREILEGLSARRTDAVCIVPTDVLAVRGAIDQVVARGLPVVTIGRDVPGSRRMAYCGPVETEVGRAAARACEAAVEGRSRTVMLLHAGPDAPVAGDRYRGFTQELSLHADLRLLREVDCRGSRTDALQQVRLESRKYPRAGCWVLLDDWPLRTLQAAQRLLPEGCSMVLCGGWPRYADRIRDGRIAALITCDFRRTVEEALLAAALLARKGPGAIPPDYTADVEIVTAANLAEHERRWEGRRGEGSEE